MPDKNRVLLNIVFAVIVCTIVGVPLLISYQHRSVVGFLCTVLVGSLIPLWLYQGKVRAALRFRDQHHALRAALKMRLTEAGLDDAHPGDRRRSELEQRFWQDAQRDAAESLRLRFGQEPKPPELGAVVSSSFSSLSNLLNSKSSLPEYKDYNLPSMFTGALVVNFVVLCLIPLDISFNIFLMEVSVFGLLLFFLSLQNMRTEFDKIEDYREFTYARRHVAELVDLAGGMTIVEGTSAGGDLQLVEAGAGDLSQTEAQHTPHEPGHV